jgi:predicted enzyme related to lactoylglutathione lyase
MKLELVPIPVTDVDRAKAFYTDKVGSPSTSTCNRSRECASSSSPHPAPPARSSWAPD